MASLFPRFFWRRLRLVLHLVRGLFTAALVFPFLCWPQRRRLKQAWSAGLLRILRIELDCRGALPAQAGLLVANHISWVDIFVINAVCPAAFVSKAEVREWPLMGWLAAVNDTIFLRRGSRGHAREVNREIAEKLAQNCPVAVFPEGTTTDGQGVLHFHAALLQPALLAGAQVTPVSLSYWGGDGFAASERSLAPRYDGDVSMGQCLDAILSSPKIVARVAFLPAVAETERRVVARLAREAICRAADIPLETAAPETGHDLPA